MLLLIAVIVICVGATSVDETITISPGQIYEVNTNLSEFYLSYEIQVTNGDGSGVDIVLLQTSEVKNYKEKKQYEKYGNYSRFNVENAKLAKTLIDVGGSTSTSLLIAPKNLNETVVVNIEIAINEPGADPPSILGLILFMIPATLCLSAIRYSDALYEPPTGHTTPVLNPSVKCTAQASNRRRRNFRPHLNIQDNTTMAAADQTWGIVGSRHFTDHERFDRELAALVVRRGEPARVVSGGATGADALARGWAAEKRIPFVEHPPASYWSRDLLARNTLIVRDSTLIVAFLAAGSRGTRDTISKAERAGKEVVVIHVD